MKRVAILTTFVGYLDSFSLCQIARVQLKMLRRAGYDVRFICKGNIQEWKAMPEDYQAAEYAEIPNYAAPNRGALEEHSSIGKTVGEQITETSMALEAALEGIDIVLTHDLIYQPSNAIQDQACMIYAMRHPQVKWLHWVHSATSPVLLGKNKINKYPNSFICYPNTWDIPRLVKNFGYEADLIKFVPHPIDYEEFFKLHPLTVKLVREKDLLSADVICCYPLRMDRGKQPDVAIEIMHQLKVFCKKSIRMVFVDFQSCGGGDRDDKVIFRKELTAKAIKCGWSENELTFMSQFDPSCQLQTPKEVVRDLLWLSSIYIHPSKSETYSLTTQEAAACKNLLILNYDFPAMLSIYGDGPLYKKFSSAVNAMECSDGETKTGYNPNRESYMREVAANINYYLENEKVIKKASEIRKTRNIDYVFKKFMEPLLYSERE